MSTNPQGSIPNPQTERLSDDSDTENTSNQNNLLANTETSNSKYFPSNKINSSIIDIQNLLSTHVIQLSFEKLMNYLQINYPYDSLSTYPISKYTKIDFSSINKNSRNNDLTNSSSLFKSTLHSLDTFHKSWDQYSNYIDPMLFIKDLTNLFKNNSIPFNIDLAQFLLDYFHPFINHMKSNTQIDLSNLQLSILELITSIILKYPSQDTRFMAITMKTIFDFISICRNTNYTIQNKVFIYLSRIMINRMKLLPELEFSNLINEFISIFNTNHPLFKLSYQTLFQSIKDFDQVKYVKSVLKTKCELSIELFNLIDQVLSIQQNNQNYFKIFQFLLNTSISQPVWNLTATFLIQRHSWYLNKDKKCNLWLFYFVRRTLQWTAIAIDSQTYHDYIYSIFHLMKILSQISPTNIKKEIEKDISTLLYNKKFNQYSSFFNITTYDQEFLDEIQVIDFGNNIIQFLTAPKTKLGPEQAKELEYIKRLTLVRAESAFLKFQNRKIDFPKAENISNTSSFFCIVISILIVIVFLTIIS